MGTDGSGIILLAESGATKTDWVLVRDGKAVMGFRTQGINAATMPGSTVASRISDAAALLPDASLVSEVHFFGAGLAGPEMSEPVVSLLRRLFPSALEITCESDLVAAARSLFGDSSGIAAILGTGSNSCFYDGRTAVPKVRSGGYVLGDEGSGAFLGKMLLSDYIKGLLPEEVSAGLNENFGLSYQSIVSKVYSGGDPAAFLASFAPYVLERKDIPYMHGLLYRTMDSFIDRMLAPYDTASYPVGIVGGFGCACRDILEEMGDRRGIRFVRFVPSPVEELVKYYV